MTDLEKWLKKMWDKHSEHGFFSYAEQQQVLRVLEVAVGVLEKTSSFYPLAERGLEKINEIAKEK